MEKKRETDAPPITVIVPDNIYTSEENNRCFDSLFACKGPLKIIVQRSMLENGNFPLKYLEKENLFPLHGDDFVKEARKRTNGERIIILKKPCCIGESDFEKLFSLNLKGKLFELAAKRIIRN